MLPLETNNAHPRDSLITFDPLKHVYTVTRDEVAERVPVSVTSFAKHLFTQFDGLATVQKHYAGWKNNARSKYHLAIHATLSSGGTDTDAKQAILQSWIDLGEVASTAGTRMHELCELVCNEVLEPAKETKETALLRAWLADFQPAMRWKPFRTEWRIWYETESPTDAVLVAGTLDLLLKSQTTGQYALVDFKRANPAPKYKGGPRELLGLATVYHPGWAMSPLSATENSKFGQYDTQLNVLSKILRDRYAIDVGERMFLLQVHEGMQAAHCVQVEAHIEQTNSLFAIETTRRRRPNV